MNLTLKIWRQHDAKASGQFVDYQVKNVTPDMSFLEMLDVLNEDLNSKGEPPVAFENDCREGICGSCGFLINGVAHGGRRGTTVCQLSMRFFKDGDSLVLEPWRARAFPVLRDLLVDRSPFDRIIQAGGFISAPTGGAPDANAILVPKEACGNRFRRRGLHRMRRMRGRLPQRVGHALHLGQAHPSQFPSPGTAAAPSALAGHGRGNVRGTVRQLHQPRRVRSGLPEENPAGIHRADEPRPAARNPTPEPRLVISLKIAAPAPVWLESAPWRTSRLSAATSGF